MAMNLPALTVESNPTPEDLAFLEDQINQFNMMQTGHTDFQWLTLFVRNSTDAIAAGLSGFTWAGACRIHVLWVHDELRGQGYGTALLQAAEAEARRRGCHVVVLETHSFQAPDFYQRLGYAVTGFHEDYPYGHRQYFLHKRLDG
jgi:ribosomal protein S18 acetylase RimI-like enzyme